MKPIYKRIVLKLTGESLADENKVISLDSIAFIAGEIKSVHDMGVEIAVVVGGGNIVRGGELAQKGRINRVEADQMGMLATTINAIALSSLLKELSLETRVQSAIEMRPIAEPVIRGRALKHLRNKRVVIFSCGTGNPHFSTDTAAVLRASEVEADAVLKATKVDGIYSADPVKDGNAELIKDISYDDAFHKRLKFMDAAAIGFAMENYPKPIHVFRIFEPGNLRRVITGETVGSKIY